jgi:tetratricopeptide (TPR) repeat protein
VHLAGCAAYVAAEASAATGDLRAAIELAGRSVEWHRAIGSLVAEAEAWQLAGSLESSPVIIAADLEKAARLADEGGDWARAATCRRERAIAVKDAEGVEAAIAALDESMAELDKIKDPAGRRVPRTQQDLAERQLRWHRLAVADQRARLLAVSGRFREAMAQVDGLEKEYQELGDAWSARDLMGLRGQLRAELDDLDGALEDLRRAAEEAESAGDPAQTRGLGQRLAAVLDMAGRPVDAEAAYDRFCSPSRT